VAPLIAIDTFTSVVDVAVHGTLVPAKEIVNGSGPAAEKPTGVYENVDYIMLVLSASKNIERVDSI
jgi:hypothetical protein